jgi:hypothetical protein
MYGLGSEEVEFCDKYSSCHFFVCVCVSDSQHERFYIAAVFIVTLI